MKKIVINIMMFLALSIVFMQPVSAQAQLETKLTSNAIELRAGDTVEVSLSFDNFNDIKKGVNAYKGAIIYDKNIFEEIVESNFECQNNWEELKYNPANGEIVAIRKVGTLVAENVVKITLKVKNDIEATTTTIQMKEMTTSEGKEDIYLKDAELSLNIIKDQEVIPSTPNIPGSPNQGTNTNHPTKPGNPENNNPTEILPIDPSNPDIGNDNNNNNEEKPPVTNPTEKDETKEEEKIKKTNKVYIWILLFILIQLIIIIILYLKHRDKDQKQNINISLWLLGIIITEFIGTTCVFAYSFALKGELNGDSQINYADVSLLELHLIDLKKLADDKLENADMNSDGKITVTDLSLLIQKLEDTLDYEVVITNIESENLHPNKNQDIIIKFNGDISFGANIKKVTMNGIEYDVEKSPNTADYTFTINVGPDAGMKEYKITEVLLDNDKKIKIDATFQIDILKDKPYIQNYRVEENKDDSKLILLFDVIDPNDSMDTGYLEIYKEEQNSELKENVVKGENRIEISVEEQQEYKAYIILNYNLSNEEENESYKGVESYEKDLQLLIDYNFTFTNIKTLKEDQETTEFNKEDQVKIIFESTNSTKHVPAFVKIGDKEYEVTQEGNQFAIILDPLENLGSNTIQIDEVTLTNGKKFELTENNTITINVNKRKPNIKDFSTTEFTETNSLKVMFHVEDPENTLKEINIILMDQNDQELDRAKINKDEIKEDGTIFKLLNTEITSQYKVKVLISYNLTEENAVEDELAIEEVVKADPRVSIKNITPSQKYIEKGGVLKLTYELETNKTEDITRILVNNTNCIAVKLENGNYEVTLNVSKNSGLYPITTTKFTYSDGTVATTEQTTNVEVLKNKPSITNFKQTDLIDTNEVTITFDLKDDENSFISGKAILTLDGNSMEKDINKDHNEITFQVEPSRKYKLEVKATYDLDNNALPDMPEEENRIVDSILTTKEIELIKDYELNISNIKTYNQEGETKYFGKSEPIQISFESTNATNFEPVTAIINGNTYPLTKKDNAYYLTITNDRTAGVKTATIEKIILNNSKEIILTENNEIKVTVLKDKPTVEEFGYKENMDATISATFKVMDEEETITNGKVQILNNGTVVKEQALEKNLNTINFQPEENQNYIIKVIADYDLDMNVLEEDANEFKDVILLESEISLGARKFEMKDIIRTSIYKQTSNGVTEVKNLSESDLTNLNNYIAKVYMKEMPTFYTTITGYRIENNKLKLSLAYNNIVQYTEENKQDKLEIEFGDMVDGVAQNITLEGLIKDIEANPTGTFTLTKDYDASIITTNTNTLISSTFMGTINGNGYKIYNLSKPLFESIESATIENLVLESPKLSGVNSRGSVTNTATNSQIRNVHVKDLTMITGINRTGGLVGEATSTTIEQCSVTNFQITTSLHIRVGGIIGNMTGGTIKNCYVEGEIKSTQNKDGNGISGILGTSEGTEVIPVENCITKVQYINNVSARLNGDIVGLALNNSTTLKNNVSLSTGTNFYHVHGSTIHQTSTNNYELTESELTSNASGNIVKQISKDEINKEFFQNNAQFDENIWDLSNVSYEHPPRLKTMKDNEETNEEETKPENNKLYIPDYNRIKNINGYTKEKDILYHNINKLMPFYDAKFLIEDGLKISNNHDLNTKIVKHILPYSNGKLVTYLNSQNNMNLTKIKVVFEDFSVREFNVTFKELNQSIAIYTIEDLDLEYAKKMQQL